MDESASTAGVESPAEARKEPAPPPPASKPFARDSRALAVETALGDALQIRSLSGEEAVSRLFRFELELVAKDASVDFKGVIGKGATVRLRLADDGARYFNGIISRIAQMPAEAGLAQFRAELVPWTWLLSRTTDCRIFQNLTVPAIVEKIFRDQGLTHFQNRLQGTYPAREYCVQYRETDFNFVSRLLEDCGIWYFFEHENGKHTLVLADNPVEHKACPAQAKARLTRSQGRGQVDVISSWFIGHELRPAKYAMTAFNFESPNTNLGVSIESVQPSAMGSKPEVYDYPGGYAKRDEGEARVKTRIEEEEAQAISIKAASTCRGFMAGQRFELTDHPRQEVNQGYVLTAVQHEAYEPSHLSRAEQDDEERLPYRNTFTALPLNVPFRPRRVTPRPVIHGVQTALVVGKKGEELWVDKHGRVKVQFHWDREGKRDENSSCWIRVSQNWAGKRFGTMFLPRVNQEVLVEFLEGDPDSPIITGRVYNGDQMPPYELPAEQTKSTIRSGSSKGGGGFNEVRFDDKKGAEQLFFHAQRDLDFVVKHDARELTEGDTHVIVQKSRLEHVKEETHLKVGGHRIEEIGGTLVLRAAKLIVESAGPIAFKSAGGFVQVDAGGVTIQGTLVNINSGGAPASADLKLRLPTQASSAAPGETGDVAEEPTADEANYDLVVAYYKEQLDKYGDKMSPEDKQKAQEMLKALEDAAARKDAAGVQKHAQSLHKVLEKTAGHPIDPPPGFQKAGVDADGHTILAPAAGTTGTTGDPTSPTSGAISPIRGQLRVKDGGYADDKGYVLPILCHLGDAFSKWSREPAFIEAILDDIAAAGYHGIRFWTTLGLDDRGGGFWAGREVGPTYTADYWTKLEAFLRRLKARNLVCQLSQGDVRRVAIPDRRAFAEQIADVVGRVGSDVVALFEGTNECRDTGEPDPDRLAQFVSYFKAKRPEVLCALSAYSGLPFNLPGEDGDNDMLRRLAQRPADVTVIHAMRYGGWPNKVEHIFSYRYEDGDKIGRRPYWQGEPAGPGELVSVTANKHELVDGPLMAMAAAALMSGQAWVYFSGPGVYCDGRERLQSMPGFRTVPKVRTMLPPDIMTWWRGGMLCHGGERWSKERTMAVKVEGTRCDHALAPDGRFVVLRYGKKDFALQRGKIEQEYDLAGAATIYIGRV
jgi:type VI secretion system secreted protein VgrG